MAKQTRERGVNILQLDEISGQENIKEKSPIEMLHPNQGDNKVGELENPGAKTSGPKNYQPSLNIEALAAPIFSAAKGNGGGGGGGIGGGNGGGNGGGSGNGGGGGAPPDKEEVGNNLSFPAIWLLGQGDDPLGLDSRSSENSLKLTVPFDPAPDADGYYYFAQKTAGNAWQAGNVQAMAPVVVDWVDIGDAMESSPVKLGRFVRLELALYDQLDAPMRAYTMTQLSEQTGPNEVQGVRAKQSSVNITENSGDIDALTGTTYQSSFATVYAPMMELTIQKFTTLTPSDDQLTGLRWDGDNQVWVGDGIGSEDVAASTQFGSELNVGGKVINGVSDKPFRYTDAGLYRVTFSLPDNIPVSFTAGTQIGDYNEESRAFDPVTEGRQTIVVADGELGVGNADTHNGLLYVDMLVPSEVGGEGEDQIAQIFYPASSTL